jgi:hypothetical protein
MRAHDLTSAERKLVWRDTLIYNLEDKQLYVNM